MRSAFFWSRGRRLRSSDIEKGVGVVPTPATEDGYYVTGDLCWVDEDRQVHLIGRQKELLQWDDGSLIDPQHVSNLLVRSVFVKDAMVARRRPEDDFLTVFIFPDYKRLEKDADTGRKLRPASIRPPHSRNAASRPSSSPSRSPG